MYVKKGEQKQEEGGQEKERPKSRKNAKEEKRGRQEKVYYVKKGAENQAQNSTAPKNIASAYLEAGDGAWQNDVDDEQIEVPTKVETATSGKIQESPSRHYNEHNIHEFFKAGGI